MLIKICGITRTEDAEAAVGAGADLVGFIFVPGTPRALDEARSGWVREVEGAEKVGVFLDSPLDTVMRVRDLLGLDWIQLHGDEPDSFLEALGEKVIRRVKVGTDIDWDQTARLAERCLPLFDPGAGDGITPMVGAAANNCANVIDLGVLPWPGRCFSVQHPPGR